jgi:hypothetical protein
MRGRAWTIVLCLILTLTITPTTGLAQDATSCDGQNNAEICITEFSISENIVQRGERVNGVLHIENMGTATGEATIVIAITQPDSPPNYYQIRRVSLDAEQSKEIPIPFTTEDSTLGEHQVNLLVLDEDENHLYDATGYSRAVVIQEDPLTLGEIAEFIRTSRAAIVIIGALISAIAFLAGRRSGGR